MIRWVHNGRLVLAISFVVLCLSAGCNGADTKKSHDNGKEQKKIMENLYPVIFADAGRSCFINSKSSGKGVTGWEAALNDKASVPYNPISILVASRQLYVYSDSLVTAFNLAGNRLWSRPIRPGSPVGIAGEVIYFRKNDKIDLLGAVTAGGQELSKTLWLLESDQSCRPIYIMPLADDFLAVSLCVGPPEGQPPVFIPYRKKYETETFLWSDRFDGTPPLMPLYISGQDRMIVFSTSEIVIYNAGASKWQPEITSRFPLPLKKIIQASCDSAGNLYLIGDENGVITLVAMNLDGEIKWRWTGGPADSYPSNGQPPVLGPDGSIYVASGMTLVTVKDGRTVREFPIEKKIISFCTALADGSVLVTAEDAIFRVDAAGQLTFGLSFDHKILTPPVVDEGGNVYIALSDKLIRIE